MGSQITVCPPPQLKIPVVGVSHWESSFVFLTHSCTHRANSAALLTPCLPPAPPLALFMKARPLSAAPSAPPPPLSLDGADYPHPESTSFTLFSSLSLSVHHRALSPLGEFSPPLHLVLLHLRTQDIVLTPQPSLCSPE